MSTHPSTEYQTVVFGPMRLTVVGIVVSLFVVASMQGVLASEVTQESDSEAVIITVDSTNLRFSPDTVTVTEGDTVRWFWSGQALPHNAVEVNGLFDSGEPAREVDYSFTFEIGMNGTYDFECEPHAAFGMVGQVIVEVAPTNGMNETNNTDDLNNTEMDDKSLPFISTTTVISVLVGVAYIRRFGGPHRGPNMHLRP